MAVVTGDARRVGWAPEGIEATWGALETLCRARIFFAHQSVGENLLAGLRDWIEASPGLVPRIVATQNGAALAPGTIAHARAGRNGDPEGKLAAFEALLGQGLAGRTDIALLELCFTDVGARTGVEALFFRYQQTFERLARRHPHVRFVHVTVPLTGRPGGVRRFLAARLGRGGAWARDNLARHRFNEALRAHAPGLFDLAAVEATDPAGREWSVAIDGHEAPVLAGPYTDDGGHLNRDGRRHAARRLIAVLAETVAARGPGGTSHEAG